MAKSTSERYYSSKNIRKLKAVYNVIYGKRSKGKTYDMLYNILSDYWAARKKGELCQAIYLRRWDTDIKQVNMSTVCDTLLCNGEGVNVVEQLTEGQYNSVRYWQKQWYLSKVDPESGLVNKDAQPFMIAQALNTWSHSKGSAYPYVKCIWFEEFIAVATDRYLSGEFTAFANFVSTVVRKRTDVTIWMTGNNVDMYCPYFEEMGLTRITSQEQGTIDTYKLGRSGKVIAVERTKDSGQWKDSEINNDYYFAFSNPELKMITSGDWEIGMYPLQSDDVAPRDICGRFFILFKTERMQCDIVSSAGAAYIYVHKDMDPLDPMDEDYDLIYTTEVCIKPNYRRSFNYGMTDAEHTIRQLINMGKVLYDSNVTGNAFEAYIKHSRGI